MLRRKIAEIRYRQQLRKALSDATLDQLRWTKEELTKEFVRRSKE